jgi:hypothetical protein
MSCDKNDGDTTPPVINLIAPAEGAVLKIGSDVHFDAEFSDNEMLQSYKVEIHNNFDGHGHHSVLKSAEPAEPFSFNQSWDISGQKNRKEHHHQIEIPENAAPGNYHLMVFCTDADGNESYLARNIVLSHEGEGHEHEGEEHDHEDEEHGHD